MCEGFLSHIPLPSPQFYYILLTFSKSLMTVVILKKKKIKMPAGSTIISYRRTTQRKSSWLWSVTLVMHLLQKSDSQGSPFLSQQSNEIQLSFASVAFSCSLFKGRQKLFVLTVGTNNNRCKFSFTSGVSGLV